MLGKLVLSFNTCALFIFFSYTFANRFYERVLSILRISLPEANIYNIYDYFHCDSYFKIYV